MERLRQRLSVALVLLLVLSLGLPAFASNISDKQAEYERVQREIAQIEKRIYDNQQEAKSINSEIVRLDKEIQQAEQQLGYLEMRLKTTETEVAAIEEDLTEAEEKLAFRQEMLKTRVRALYERGTVSYLEVLLNARSFSDLINRVNLLRQVVAHDVNVVDSIRSEKARIEEQKNILELKRQDLARLRQETERNRGALASRQAEHRSYLTKLERDREAWLESLRDIELVAQELERLIREGQGANPNPVQGTGTYTWPTPGYTRITSPYGQRNHPIFGGSSFHYGIDIGAPMGAKIVAADSGTVLFAGWMTGYGQVVILDHGNGRSTLYAHASVLLVKNNQRVIKGQQIAKVGSTGWSTGAHLHFEFRINGAKQNPLNYVKRP